MQGISLARQCIKFLSVLDQLQEKTGGQPVTLSVDEWAQVTGISPETQVRVRQWLMGSGLLRLSVEKGRWTYAIGGTK